MSGIKGAAGKASIIALEIAGVVLAVAAGVAAFLAWRIQSGPVSLSALRPSAEFAVARTLPKGHAVRIGELTLSRGEGDAFKLTIADTAINDAKGAPLVSLARVDAVFAVSDLAHGAFGPRFLEFEKPVIAFTRADGAIKADAAGPGDFDIIRLLNDRAWLRDSFRRAEFHNATIVYKDTASGRTWRSQGAAASLSRTKAGFDADLNGSFDMNGKPAALSFNASYVEERRVIDAELKVAAAPVGDILGMFYGDQAAILQAPVSGLARIKMTDKGVVLASAVDLKSSAGTARFGADSFAVEFVTLKANFDPKTDSFDDLKLGFSAGGSSGEIGGRATLTLAADKRSVLKVDFALRTSAMTLNPQGVFAEPLVVERADLEGAYDVSGRTLSLSRIEAGFLGVILKGAAEIERGERAKQESPGVKVDLKLDGALDPRRIAKGWPLNLAATVRDFIDTRLPAARVENVALAIDLAQGALGHGRLMPDEALSLTFDVSGATAIFDPGMTPLSDASAAAKLTGNRFVMTNAKGRVGAVPVADGLIDFTRLAPKGAPVHYTFSAEGAARDFIKILNEEPIAILKTTKLTPGQFSGKARARITLTRPNLRLADRSDYGYAGVIDFQNVTIAEFFRGGDLERASGRIDLKARQMNVAAAAEFGGAPIKIDWLQRFYSADGPSKFDIAGTVDSTTGDFFGVPTRQMLRGPVSFKATAIGDLSAIRTLSLEADFTRAALTVDALNWRKPPDVRAFGKAEAEFSAEAVTVRAASLEGDEIAVRGGGAFSPAGALQSAVFERVYLGGGADLSLTARRNEIGALEAQVVGAFLNAGPLIEKTISSPRAPNKNDPWKSGLRLDAKLNEVVLRGGARFKNASLILRRSGEGLEKLEFSATTADEKPVSATMTPAPDGARRIEAKSGDLGAVIAGLFGVTSIKDGEGALTLTLIKNDAGANAIEGRADARDMRVVKAPMLARIFAAGSFDGLSDLLNGDGIDLAKARADFAFRDGVVTIRNARATGPSIGITGEGEFHVRNNGPVALKGAVAPAYQLNSFLGKTPLVGDIFINRKGEGLMALSYTVSGTTAAPTVSVNPLSALTPGVLRRMFEGREPEANAEGETSAN